MYNQYGNSVNLYGLFANLHRPHHIAGDQVKNLIFNVFLPGDKADRIWN